MKFNLRTSAWSAGGNDPVALSILPPGMRVRSIHLHAVISGTCGAGESIAANLLPSVFTSIRLGKWFNTQGYGLMESNRRMAGRYVYGSVGHTAGPAVFSVTHDLWLHFRDPRRQAATDGSVITELLQPLSLELGYAAAALYGGTIVITAGAVNVVADLIDEQEVSELFEEGFIDPGAQTIKLDGGYVYTDIWASDGGAVGSVTPAEITNVDMLADGKYRLNNAPHGCLVADFNRECITDLAGIQVLATPEHLSLLHQELKGAQLTKAMAVEGTGNIQVTGTLSPRIYYRRVVLKDMATIQATAAAMGQSVEGKTIEPHVASKAPVRAMHEVQRTGVMNKKSRVIYGALATKLRNTPTAGSVALARK